MSSNKVPPRNAYLQLTLLDPNYAYRYVANKSNHHDLTSASNSNSNSDLDFGDAKDSLSFQEYATTFMPELNSIKPYTTTKVEPLLIIPSNFKPPNPKQNPISEEVKEDKDKEEVEVSYNMHVKIRNIQDGVYTADYLLPKAAHLWRKCSSIHDSNNALKSAKRRQDDSYVMSTTLQQITEILNTALPLYADSLDFNGLMGFVISLRTYAMILTYLNDIVVACGKGGGVGYNEILVFRGIESSLLSSPTQQDDEDEDENENENENAKENEAYLKLANFIYTATTLSKSSTGSNKEMEHLKIESKIDSTFWRARVDRLLDHHTANSRSSRENKYLASIREQMFELENVENGRRMYSDVEKSEVWLKFEEVLFICRGFNTDRDKNLNGGGVETKNLNAIDDDVVGVSEGGGIEMTKGRKNDVMVERMMIMERKRDHLNVDVNDNLDANIDVEDGVEDSNKKKRKIKKSKDKKEKKEKVKKRKKEKKRRERSDSDSTDSD